MKRKFACLAAAVPLLMALPLNAENRFFHLAGKDFSAAEAAMFSTGKSDFAAAAAIVLCERAGVKLSEQLTRAKLQDALQLLSKNSRKKFDSELSQKNLSEAAWLDQQAKLLHNQINEAVLRWYIKTYGSDSAITNEHIRAWYYRNYDLFRRLKVDPAGAWVFRTGEPEKLRTALAALQQGMPDNAVRTAYAEKTSVQQLDSLLRNAEDPQQLPENDYILIPAGEYSVLLRKSAAVYDYLPLDDSLQKAIGNALYDALAKARLAEILKKEFADKKIIFY